MQQKNSQRLKNFQVVQKLGEGSYSQVFKVIRLSDNQIYAMKKVKMNMLKEKEKENALNEVRILASFNDPYIVGYKEAFIDEESQVLCIVMDFANDGDLQQLIQQSIKKGITIKENQIWRALYQMTRGLKKLHDMKIVHRDLKCANVFISDGVFQLGDLNVSKVAKKGLVYTQTGTPYYASPEVWRDEPYDMKSDIWSLGCVLYEMTTLKPPFRSNDMQGLYKKVQKGLFETIPKEYSKDLQIILSAMIQVSPMKRPTCQQLLNNPLLLKQVEELIQFDKTAGKKNELLQTIQLPRNLKSLKDCLPKSKYENGDLNRSQDHIQKNGNNKQTDNSQRKSHRVQSAAPLQKIPVKPQQQQRVSVPENYDQYPSAPRNVQSQQKQRTKDTEPVSPVNHVTNISPQKDDQIGQKNNQIGQIEVEGQPFTGLIVEGLHKLNPMSIQSILCQPVLNIEDYPFPIQAKVLKKKPDVQQKPQAEILPIKGGHNQQPSVSKQNQQPQASKQRIETNYEYRITSQTPKTNQYKNAPPKELSKNNIVDKQRPESAQVEKIQKLQDKYQHYYPISQQQQLYLDKMKQDQIRSHQRIIKEQLSSPSAHKLDRITSSDTNKRQTSAQGRNQYQKIYN